MPRHKTVVRVEYPNVCDNGDLLSVLFDVGPLGPGGRPLTYSEIESADRILDLGLTPWEAKTLRKMSREYANTSYEAVDPAMPAPYTTGVADDHARQAVADRFKSIARKIKPKKRR